MNKQAYHVIFSKVSNTFIAVAETVPSHGKSKSTNTQSTSTVKNSLLRFTTLSVVVAALFGSVVNVHAQTVAYKNGAGPKPTIDQTANGRTLVQIVKPNATGLSHNRYDQFNVDKNGTILNNSSAVTQTQLGGYIGANPNLAPGVGAKVILNEVMSTNRSQLNGYIEVAGQRADVIVANPNGISVNGAGFINASRGVLTTGTPTFGGDGSLAAFRVSKGDINIGAGGMNATGTDQLDLIARSVQVNDALWANQLNVVAGSNQVNYANLGVQVIAGEGEKPTVSIDSSALGGMYAQKIMLVGTEAGVGVRTLGTISASAGDITIDSHGKISLNGQTNAKGALQLRSDDDISNTGTLYGQQAVTIASNGQVTNSGTLAALRDLAINAKSIHSSGVLGAGINGTGQATEAGNLTLTSSGLITATGQNIAGNNITITGSGINFTDGVTGSKTSANGAVTLLATAGDINNAGATLQSIGNAILNATGNIINDEGVIQSGQLTTQSDALSNIAGSLIQTGTGNTQIITTNKFNNTSGSLISNGQNLLLRTGSLTNAKGNISHAGMGGLTITTGELDNTEGNIAALVGLDITANNLINAAGTIQNLGNVALNLQINQRLSNTKKNNVSGFIGSASNINIHAFDIDNTAGTIYSKKNIALKSDNTLNNEGGVIQSDGTISAVAGGAINNQSGRIEANGNGVDPAAETLLVKGSNINNTRGRIANSSIGSTTIHSDSVITNTAGVIGGNGDVTLNADVLNNTQQGQVIAAHNLYLQRISNLNNNQGSLYAAKNLTLQQGNATVNNQQGSISAAGNISLDVASLDNTQGQIVSSASSEAADAESDETGDITLTVANQINNTAGTIGSKKDLRMQARSLFGDGRVTAGQDAIVQLQGDHTFTNNNAIRANRDFSFSTTGTITNTGNLEAVRHLTLNAGNIINLYGALINAGYGRTMLNATQLVYNLGRIYGDDIAIQANNITNDGLLDANGNSLQAGVIAARNDIDIGANTIINREYAVIQSMGNMSIGGALDANHRATGKAAYLLNASATIDAGANLNLQVVQLDNVNTHFVTEQRRDDRLTRQVRYYMIDGSDVKYYDGIDAIVVNEDDIDKLVINGKRYNDYTIFNYLETTERTYVLNSEPGRIVAGGQIILSGLVSNDKSVILAGGIITGDLTGLTNTDANGITKVIIGGDGKDHEGKPLSYMQYHTTSSGSGGRDDDYHEKLEFKGDSSTTAPLNIVRKEDGQDPNHRDNDSIGIGVDDSDIPLGDGSTIGGNQDNPNLSDDVPRDDGAPIPIFTLPKNQLFPVTTNPNATYVVETDPKFTNYRTFLSSDYMLSRLSVDPQHAQKRLGDGFYEQKLINDQILQLTGKRFLGDYTTNEQQYQALMESGITMAEQFQLTPGIALTAAQMAALTSDMVWLVSQDITMPDGTKNKVLVPVIYLAKAGSAEVQPNGSIISGRNIDLAINGTLQNDGTMQATNNALIRATDIVNTGTLKTDAIKGNTVLIADNDIINTGGNIAGKNVGLLAGRDVVMSTTVSENKSNTGNAQQSFSSENNVIDKVASITADQLSIQSGRDITLNATQVDTTGNTSLVAGRDLNLGTVTTKEAFNANYDAQNNLSSSQTNVIGTQITTGGNLIMSATQDINAKAAYANATGTITAAAGRDVNIASAQQEHNYAQETFTSSSGILSSGTLHTQSTKQSTQSIGTTFSGDKVTLAAGHDLNILGSNVVATSDVNLIANNNVNITAAQNTSSSYYDKQEQNSGLMGASGGIGITIGEQETQNTQTSRSTTHSASTVGSTNGNVTIQAGNAYTQTGSNVMSLQGDTTVLAKTIDINAVTDTHSGTEDNRFEQSGLTLAISSPVIAAVQTVSQMASATSQTDDPRMKLMGAAVAGKAIVDGVKAAQTPTQAVTVSLTVGSTQSESHSEYASSTAQGSNITAGGNVNLIATGAGKDSHINVIGSNINANENVALISDGNINLEAAKNSSSQHSTNSSSSAAIGVAATYGSNGMALGVTASASGSRGNADGDDTSYTNTHVNAGKQLVIVSGGDTTLKGAVASANQVIAQIGGNLNMESLQDTSNYASKDQNIGGSVTIGYGYSGSINVGQTKVNGDYKSVGEQTGIAAGDGGFQIDVKGNTDLKGAVIASTQNAIDQNKNNFTTGTLTQSELQNHSNYEASSFSIGAGFGSSGSDDKQSDPNAQDTPSKGVHIARFDGSSSPTSAGFSSEDGNTQSVTRSGISGNANGGGITIVNDQAQQALTGNTAAETVASINKDITTTTDSNSLTKDWDAQQLKDQVNAGAQITAAFSSQAGEAVSDYAQKQRSTLQEQLKNASTPEEQQALQKQINDVNMQERAMNVLIGAVTGTGGVALTRETLGAAADVMRQMMIEDSKKFPGVTDGETTLSNASGESDGVRGGGFKGGGTRVDLDKLCGAANERCKTNSDGSLALTEKGQVQFDPSAVNGLSLAQYLETPEGKEMGGLTGGIQGWKGTLAGRPYEPGDLIDTVIESYAGPHDEIGGKRVGAYDELGNTKRGRDDLVKKLHDTWSATGAIVLSTPFGMAEALPPEVWKAISILIGVTK
jgi:filamentous hemagglutinin